MRSASKAALARAIDGWRDVLEMRSAQENTPGKLEDQLADELFALASTLESAHALTSLLEDGARSADDRASLVRSVFHGKVADEIEELLEGLVRERWSESGDLCSAVEELGVYTHLFGAQREGTLSNVEEELYQISRLLVTERDLRLAFTSVNYSLEAREKLAADVFTTANRHTLALFQRSLSSDRTIAGSLRHYINAAARIGEHLVAAVTSAVALSEAQEERLANILRRKYGEEVRVHVAIDPAVVGGLRIHINDDVIDGTLASRLKSVHEAFSN